MRRGPSRPPHVRQLTHLLLRRALPASTAVAALVSISGCSAAEPTASSTDAAAKTVVVTHALTGPARPGARVPLTVTVKSAQGTILTGRPITWSSRVPSVATVDGAGVATAIATGTTVIDATVDGVTGSTSLSVAPVPVATVTLSASSVSMLPSTTTQLNAVARDSTGTTVTGRPITWSSSDLYVLSVNGAGMLTAVTPGTAVVQASVDGVTGSAQVTVLPRVIMVGQSIPSLTGAVGTPQFTVTVPEGTRSLLVRTSEGSGELSLWLYQGESTAADHQVCLSASASTRQLCAIANPIPGPYIVRLTRYTSNPFSDVTLAVNPVLPVLSLGQAVNGLAADGPLLYLVTIPSGLPALTVRTSGGTGSLVLTVFEGDVPATGWARCAGMGSGTTQSCTIPSPPAGVYTVRLTAGTGTFAGVSLQAIETP